MAAPRKKRVETPDPAEMSTEGIPPVYNDRVIPLIPALEALVAWSQRHPNLDEVVTWFQERKALLAQAGDSTQETERITFHVERRWIEAIRRQADLDGLTITQVVNEAFRRYFDGQ